MEENNNNNNIWRTIGLLLIGAFIGYLTGRFAGSFTLPSENIKINTPENTNKNTQQVKQIQQINPDDDPALGSNTAEVTIVDFSDYQCPFCKNFYKNIYLELKKDYINTGKIKYIFRDFPLNIHKNALAAANAADCSGEQGKYWEMHDKLFEDQNNWSKSDTPKDIFKSYAKELGLNTYLFNECIDSDKYNDEVMKDKEEGKSYGVNGTPTLFFNGQILRGGYSQDYDLFQNYLEKEFGI